MVATVTNAAAALATRFRDPVAGVPTMNRHFRCRFWRRSFGNNSGNPAVSSRGPSSPTKLTAALALAPTAAVVKTRLSAFDGRRAGTFPGLIGIAGLGGSHEGLSGGVATAADQEESEK